MWATIKATIKREPVLLTGGATALIALVISFGLGLSTDQVGGIMGVVAFVVAFIARSQVTPSREVAAQKIGTGPVLAGPAATITTGVPVNITTLAKRAT